jgi:hypothetical protein
LSASEADGHNCVTFLKERLLKEQEKRQAAEEELKKCRTELKEYKSASTPTPPPKNAKTATLQPTTATATASGSSSGPPLAPDVGPRPPITPEQRIIIDIDPSIPIDEIRRGAIFSSFGYIRESVGIVAFGVLARVLAPGYQIHTLEALTALEEQIEDGLARECGEGEQTFWHVAVGTTGAGEGEGAVSQRAVTGMRNTAWDIARRYPEGEDVEGGGATIREIERLEVRVRALEIFISYMERF